MDDIERVITELVRNIETRFPELLDVPFRIQEIHERLIPYRAHRAALGVETSEYYELAITRILCGEGGYVSAPDAVKNALSSELASPNPDSHRFREFDTTDVKLTPLALRFRGGSSSVEKPEVSNGSSSAGSPSVRTISKPTNTKPSVTTTSATEPALPAVNTAVPRATKNTNAPQKEWTMPPGQRTTSAKELGGKCRYCHGVLPDGRELTYCPHCGQDLTVHHCPACSTELAVGWKFCVTCGRSVDE